MLSMQKENRGKEQQATSNCAQVIDCLCLPSSSVTVNMSHNQESCHICQFYINSLVDIKINLILSIYN